MNTWVISSALFRHIQMIIDAARRTLYSSFILQFSSSSEHRQGIIRRNHFQDDALALNINPSSPISRHFIAPEGILEETCLASLALLTQRCADIQLQASVANPSQSKNQNQKYDGEPYATAVKGRCISLKIVQSLNGWCNDLPGQKEHPQNQWKQCACVHQYWPGWCFSDEYP